MGGRSKCYACNPYSNRKLDYYLWLDRPGTPPDQQRLRHCFVNQNLKGLEELVIVPKAHVGEFRRFPAERKALFWKEVGDILGRLHEHGARNMTLEISYGSWIVHKAGTPHYHAHIHLMFDNFPATLRSLDKKAREGGGSSILRRRVNTQPHQVYEGDVIVPLAPFSPLSFFEFCDRLCVKYPLFVMVSGWFKQLTGFVFQIKLADDDGQWHYALRTDKTNGAAANNLVTRTPRAIIAQFAALAAAQKEAEGESAAARDLDPSSTGMPIPGEGVLPPQEQQAQGIPPPPQVQEADQASDGGVPAPTDTPRSQKRAPRVAIQMNVPVVGDDTMSERGQCEPSPLRGSPHVPAGEGEVVPTVLSNGQTACLPTTKRKHSGESDDCKRRREGA